MAVQTQITQANRRERLIGIGLMLISGLSFAWLPLFNRYASEAGANVLTTLTLRFVIAALITWSILLAKGRARLLRRNLWALLLMGAIYVGQSTCFFISSRRIPVAMTSILLYLYP